MRETARSIGVPCMVVGIVGMALGMLVGSHRLVAVGGVFTCIGVTLTGVSFVKWKETKR